MKGQNLSGFKIHTLSTPFEAIGPKKKLDRSLFSGSCVPNCILAVACADIGAPIYGTKSSSDYSAGSTLSFTCNAGYSLYGSSSRTCQAGEWTGRHPKCLGNLVEAPIASTKVTSWRPFW